MDLAWIATAVTAVAGAVVAIWIHTSSEKAATAREERTLTREREREAATEQRRRREFEHDSVMRLSEIFLKARQSAEGWDSYSASPPPFDDVFPEQWQSTYYEGISASELVTNELTRVGLQDCLQAVLWSGALQQLPGWGSAREIARNSASVGFVVAGAWLRDEPLLPDTANRLAGVQRMLRAYDEYWIAQMAPGHELNGTPDPLTSKARRNRNADTDRSTT
ncbi:hypothetical protein [Leifsonia aquatica]|uniref:hypothetical protein n=1 Tax=Leifsonia aquatica TaxID=144185 RepID=UPI00382E3BEF